MLEGENVKPSNNKQARSLIGKKVKYLRNCDIDKSGRNYIFPQTNRIKGVIGRQIILHNEDTMFFKEIVEMVVLEEPTEAEQQKTLIPKESQ
jgi:hypothetical protein